MFSTIVMNDARITSTVQCNKMEYWGYPCEKEESILQIRQMQVFLFSNFTFIY